MTVAAMNRQCHASTRAKQRGVPPLIDQWLSQFGEETYDGRGGVIRHFSRASIRDMERAFGRAPLRKLAEYLDAYKVEASRSGEPITTGRRYRRINRK